MGEWGVTSGSGFARDWAGLRFSTRVRDKGTSANDAADQISISLIEDVNGDPTVCTEQAADTPLLDTPQGQVVVK